MPKPRRAKRNDRNHRTRDLSLDILPFRSQPKTLPQQLLAQLCHRRIPVCMYLKNHSGHYVWLNAFAKAQWLPKNATCEKPTDSDLFSATSLMLTKKRDQDSMRHGHVRVDIDRIQLQSGEFMTYRAVRVPILDDDRRVWGLFGICDDLTAQCENIERLKQDVAHKEQTLHMVSHELRNPLWTLAMCVERLRHAAPPSEEPQLQLVELMDAALQQMKRLATDLVDVAQLKNTSIKIEAESVRLQRILNLIQESRGAGTHSEKSELKIHAFDPNIEIFCDPTRVQQIFSNLLDNAFRYSPQRHEVELSVGIRGESVVFFVDDAGPGVSHGVSDTLFDPYTTEPGPKGRHGLGMGLHIAKKLVEAQDGQIWYEPSPLGGARFAFTLPRNANAQRMGGDYPASSFAGAGSRKRDAADTSEADQTPAPPGSPDD